MPPHPPSKESDTEFIRKQGGVSLFRVFMSFVGAVMMIMIAIIGWGADRELSSIDAKLDKSADKQEVLQLKVNTLSDQITDLAPRVDKLETGQRDMFDRLRIVPAGTRPGEEAHP